MRRGERRCAAISVLLPSMRLLVVNPSSSELPESLNAAAAWGWRVQTESSPTRAQALVDREDIAAALVIEPATDAIELKTEVQSLLRRLSDRRVATTVVACKGSVRTSSSSEGFVDVVDGELTAAELKGRLAVIARYHAMLRRMELELRNMDEMSARLKEHFRLIDQEMRLAGRLQRDFLPKAHGRIGAIRYASVYRPASWVSGDIFDIIRIDDNHTGIFIADAVGHGMAAGLLTMFIKRAVTQTFEVGGPDVNHDPATVLTGLNEALAAQELPNCQFVTACYGVLEHDSLRFDCARAGHPAPLLLRPGGSIREIDPVGGLLGLHRGEGFDVQTTTLARGDKILMYTDGIELAFPESADSAESYRNAFATLAELSLEDFTAQMGDRLDKAAGSIKPADDITIIGLEVD